MMTTRILRRLAAGPAMLLGAALIASFGTTAAARADGAPTIASDQADYAPGGTVTLTGTNWSGDDSVHITVNDDQGQTWGHVSDPAVPADGSISDAFQLPNWFIATYDVTATGNLTGRTASTTFTDSSSNLDQCVDGGVGNTPEPCKTAGFSNWVNGNANGQKAHWAEGDFIPYRATVGPVAAGSHTLEMHYDTVHDSTHPPYISVGFPTMPHRPGAVATI